MLKLATKLAWRDWRGGELYLLMMALILAITSLSSISLFTARVQQTMVSESAVFLAADLRLNGSAAIQPQWQTLAREYDVEQALVQTFQGMLFSNDGMQLASVKAVTDNYPLKGSLKTSEQAFGTAQTTLLGPKSGELWLDSRLMASLNTELGDSVDVGEAALTVTKVLISEPDQAGGFAGFAPRAMINMADFAATEAVKPGSRISRSWLLSGDQEALQIIQQSVQPELQVGQAWLTPDGANNRLGDTLARAEQFLLLAGSLTVMLAGVALVLSARRYSLRQANHVALLKCLGLKPRQLRFLYMMQMLMLGLLAILLSLPLSWLLHLGLLNLISDYLQVSGAAPLFPFILGAATGLLCLLAFVMPSMLDLSKVTPAQALHQSLARHSQPARHWVIGFVAMLGLVYWQSQSVLITGGLMAAVAVLSLSLLLLTRLILIVAGHYKYILGHAGKLGLANLQRRSKQNGAQIMIFALSLMLLFSLLGVRNFLIDDWQQRLEEDTPNIFLLNIFGEQRQAINQFVIDQDINEEGLSLFPMTRGRLIYPDPKVMDEQTKDRPGPPAGRERNLSWSETFPENNILVAGNWWTPETQELQVSVELDYAERFGWKVGDRLVYSVAGIEHDAVIANLRAVDWGGLQPNFFLIFSKPLTDEYSTTYLASMYVSDEKRPQLSELLRQQATISVIDVEQILAQVQKVVGQLSMAVESILLLLLLAGILVLLASVQASHHERLQESAILRTLGAHVGLVRNILLVEYVTMGIIAGFLAGLGAETLLAVVQTQVFDLPFAWHWELWLLAPICGAVIIGATGWWFNRKVVTAPPLRILRQLT